MINLRPCPFDSDHDLKEYEHVIPAHSVSTGDVPTVDRVKCERCGIEKKKEHWNSRPMLDEAIEALEEISKCTDYPTCDMAKQALSNIKRGTNNNEQ
jgi:hypothetical protein